VIQVGDLLFNSMYPYIDSGTGGKITGMADVVGQGIPAAILISATAAAMRFEANHDRNMLEQMETIEHRNPLRIGLGTLYSAARLRDRHSKSDASLYQLWPQPRRSVSSKDRRPLTLGLILSTDRISPDEICDLASEDVMAGSVFVFYTDGLSRSS